MTSSILTATSKWFDVLNPSPELIDLEDIAAALSKLCRFGGHCREFYSVAEHSLHVSTLAAESAGDNLMVAKWGLLHDASEAYVVDLPKPVKRQIPDYVEMEGRLQRAIAERFDLPWPMPVSVHDADKELLAIEIRQLMIASPMTPPLPTTGQHEIELHSPMLSHFAQSAFKSEAQRLGLI